MNKQVLILWFALGLAACREKDVQPAVWKSIEASLQEQLILAEDGGTIELPEGHFMFTRTLSLDGKKSITIRGKGMDKTVLSWKNQTEGAQGMLISNGYNIKLEDFTLQDAKGDNLKVTNTRGIILRRIRSQWSDGPKTENGAYALYPVLCTRVLIEECVAMGASDAGIYVGQSDTVVIRKNKAYWNVAGIEAENSKYVEIHSNEAYENTGGILVFDLPGLTTYGHTTRVYNNVIRDNNLKNFARKGNIVASIPPGSGLMILATHDAEASYNKIYHNKTVGVGIISYELVAALTEGEADAPQAEAGVQTVNNRFREDSLYNPYPYNILIHRNEFRNHHFFPSLNHEIGKLLAWKSLLRPPDILYDGITRLQQEDPKICLGDNGKIRFINLDAAHDFKNLSTDPSPFECFKKNPYLDLKL